MLRRAQSRVPAHPGGPRVGVMVRVSVRMRAKVRVRVRARALVRVRVRVRVGVGVRVRVGVEGVLPRGELCGERRQRDCVRRCGGDGGAQLLGILFVLGAREGLVWWCGRPQ